MRYSTLYDYSTCGISIWHDFFNPNCTQSNYSRFGGIDFAIAGFVDMPECEKVYNHIKQRHTIVYQSPVKKNKHTDNEFFFVVFSKGKK